MRAHPTRVFGLGYRDSALPSEHDIEEQITVFDAEQLFRTNLDAGQGRLVKGASAERTDTKFRVGRVEVDDYRTANERRDLGHCDARGIGRDACESGAQDRSGLCPYCVSGMGA
ncbi:hypothetical protein ASD59_01565 [Brevundimonas sp. Root608]|nr:hypothetical protein ASD59_01565 [Brevundimonas sp. Root608]